MQVVYRHREAPKKKKSVQKLEKTARKENGMDMQYECTIAVDERGKEREAHGTPSFPVACFRTQIESLCILPHWHDDLEMLVVTEGVCALYIGTDEYLVQCGQGFFVNAGVLHAMPTTDVSKSGSFISIVFHPRLIGGGMESVFWRRYMEPILYSQDLKGIWFDGSENWHAEANDAIVAAWDACSSQKIGFEFETREALSRVVLLLLQSRPIRPKMPSRKAVRDDERVKQMMQYIRQNYAQDIKIEDLCRCASISESECLRCFKATIGTTPMQYVKEYRLDKAASMLLETNLSTGEIGGQCGFSDPSYFSKCFRTWSGMAPTEYRRTTKSKAQ